jgi:hypothetical protein
VIDGTPILSPTTPTTTNGTTIGPPFLYFATFPTQTLGTVTTEGKDLLSSLHMFSPILNRRSADGYMMDDGFPLGFNNRFL